MKVNNIIKLTYYLSIFLIAVWLLRRFVFWFIGLEFADSNFEFQYLYSWVYILPFAIMLTLAKEFEGGKRPKKLVQSILVRVGLSVLSVLIVFISLFTNMCGWLEKDIYYLSKHDSGRISLMEYSCGAYDSDTDIEKEIRMITPLNSYFNWANKCDTTTIDKENWQRVKL
jgi:hypothetical protein